MSLNFNNKKKYSYSILLFLSIFFIIFLLNNYNQNNKINNIYIIIHGVWIYSLKSILFEYYRKELITERWNQVKNKKAEQRGLIDITNINNPEEYLERERSIIQYKKNNNKEYAPYSNIKYFKYNWDGFLSEKSRNNAGEILAKEILLLKKKYPDSQIHIIGYSHGGNVALNLIKYLPKDSELIIDELILLATPIGKKTEELAKRKNKNGKYFFKEIFCLYSKNDFIQIKDFLFNFPICHRFLEERLDNVHIVRCQYKYYYPNAINKKIKYLPNHKDFMIESKNKLIEKKYFTYLPIIFYLPQIIHSKRHIPSRIKILKHNDTPYTLPLEELHYNDNKSSK